MKVNNRRKVFVDAVDMLMEDIEKKTAPGGLRTRENVWKIWLPV